MLVVDRCFAEPVQVEISEGTFSRSSSANSDWGAAGSRRQSGSGYLGTMSASMLRSRSQSLLPITNQPLEKRPTSFSTGRRTSRNKRCYRPVLALIALSVLFGGVYVYTRPSLPSSSAAADRATGNDPLGFGSTEAGHRRKSNLNLDSATLDRYHDQQMRMADDVQEHLSSQQSERKQQHTAAASLQATHGGGFATHDDVVFDAERVEERRRQQEQQQLAGAAVEGQQEQQQQAVVVGTHGQEQQAAFDAQQAAALAAQQAAFEAGQQQQQQQQQLELGQQWEQHGEQQHQWGEQQQQEQQQEQHHQEHQWGEQQQGGHLEEVVPPPRELPSLYESGLSAVDIHGNLVHLSDFRGKATIILNVASHCGYTESNYVGLQQIYDRYNAYGLEILAFPCNQFGEQEAGTHDEIVAFVEQHYQAKFPLMSKVEVNGMHAHPIFTFLKQHTPPMPGHPVNEDITWNFNKFLVDKWGHPVKRYASDLVPYEVETDVYNELIKPYPAVVEHVAAEHVAAGGEHVEEYVAAEHVAH